MDKEISAVDAANLLKKHPTAIILDVREESEIAICQIKGSLHIPIKNIPSQLGILPKKEPLVVICHYGMRSQNVVHYLREKGYKNAINLIGGIDAWANEVDINMLRY